jgi:predicted phage-related endonuclease
VAYLRTPDGVFIELTDQAQQCADGSWYFYVAASDATTINTGCWTYRAPFVLTQDRSGTIYQYPQENFVRTSVAFDELLR